MRFAIPTSSVALLLGALTLLASSPVAVDAAPTGLMAVHSYSGEKVTRAFIVQFKANVTESRAQWASRLGKKCTGNWNSINGIVSELDEDELNELRMSPDVLSIEEDGVMSIAATQRNAPWGLSRIFSDKFWGGSASAQNFRFDYDDSAAGEGVDIYVLDTGILPSHSEFEGRARAGPAFTNGLQISQSIDLHGHGTHCAGTAAGKTFGVAKKASIIGVQVLRSDTESGYGLVSDIISGMGWVLKEVGRTGRPSVVSMSFGGIGIAPALDAAVARLTYSGVHVVVAAGNDNEDAWNDSPGRAPSAITVGATNIRDQKAWFSNFGPAVDIWAFGESVISSYIGSDTATKALTGTSMAAPHVSGAIAYLISRDGDISPMAMAEKLASMSLKDRVSKLPRGTVNRLLHID